MGRGERPKAMREARNLLYGRRSLGTRPVVEDLPEPAKRLSECSWNEYVRAVADLAVSLDLSQPATAEQLRSISEGKGDLSTYAAIDIKKGGRECIRLVPTINAEGHSVGIYTATDTPRNAIYLDKGQGSIDDVAQVESVLRDTLVEQGVKQIGLALDGRELLARLDAGRKIKLTGGEHSLDNLKKWPWSQKLLTAHKMVDQAKEAGYITEAEAKEWVTQISRTKPNGDIFDSMKNDRIGRSILGCQSAVYVAETIAPD